MAILFQPIKGTLTARFGSQTAPGGERWIEHTPNKDPRDVSSGISATNFWRGRTIYRVDTQTHSWTFERDGVPSRDTDLSWNVRLTGTFRTLAPEQWVRERRDEDYEIDLEPVIQGTLYRLCADSSLAARAQLPPQIKGHLEAAHASLNVTFSDVAAHLQPSGNYLSIVDTLRPPQHVRLTNLRGPSRDGADEFVIRSVTLQVLAPEVKIEQLYTQGIRKPNDVALQIDNIARGALQETTHGFLPREWNALRETLQKNAAEALRREGYAVTTCRVEMEEPERIRKEREEQEERDRHLSRAVSVQMDSLTCLSRDGEEIVVPSVQVTARLIPEKRDRMAQFSVEEIESAVRTLIETAAAAAIRQAAAQINIGAWASLGDTAPTTIQARLSAEGFTILNPPTVLLKKPDRILKDEEEAVWRELSEAARLNNSRRMALVLARMPPNTADTFLKYLGSTGKMIQEEWVNRLRVLLELHQAGELEDWQVADLMGGRKRLGTGKALKALSRPTTTVVKTDTADSLGSKGDSQTIEGEIVGEERNSPDMGA